MDTDTRTAAVQALLDVGTLPMQAPGYQARDFWSFPICRTLAPRPFADSMLWQDVLTYQDTNVNYQSVIDEFLLTTVDGVFPAGVDLRLTINGAVPTFIQGTAVNRSFDGIYPLIRRQTYILLTHTLRLALQVRNQSGGPVSVAAGVFGWKHYVPGTGAEIGSSEQGGPDAG